VIKGSTTWSNASTNRLWGNFGLTPGRRAPHAKETPTEGGRSPGKSPGTGGSPRPGDVLACHETGVHGRYRVRGGLEHTFEEDFPRSGNSYQPPYSARARCGRTTGHRPHFHQPLAACPPLRLRHGRHPAAAARSAPPAAHRTASCCGRRPAKIGVWVHPRPPGSFVEVRPARPDLLWVCAHVRAEGTEFGVCALDLLVRTCELGGLQAPRCLHSAGGLRRRRRPWNGTLRCLASIRPRRGSAQIMLRPA
jgi:hypothetical protein